MSIQINTDFKISQFYFYLWCQQKYVYQKKKKKKENEKIQLFPPVTPGVLNTYFYQPAIMMPLYQIFLHFWIILLQSAHNFDLLN